MLVNVLNMCGNVAKRAPDEMAKAITESRDMERLCPSPWFAGRDLSQEGVVILPTTPATLSRLGLCFYQAAVEICDAALAAVGGRSSPAADDERRLPSMNAHAQVCGSLAGSLTALGEDTARSLALMRQSVALGARCWRRRRPLRLANCSGTSPFG